MFGEAKPQPHHVEFARTLLLSTGEIVDTTVAGKGGRDVRLFQVADAKGRVKSVTAAAMRKRALMNRYYGWAQGTESYPGITGPAAEAVVHDTIIRSGIGNLLSDASARVGSVSSFLGQPVPIGPLDNAFLFLPLDENGRIRFSTTVGVPVEVKNVREWIYPRSRELYQLLAKSARLQRELPTVPLIPLLVCRRASTPTHRMAKALGFFVIQARQQFIQNHSRATPEHLVEVRTELGLLDLVVPSGPSLHVAAGLRALQQKYPIDEATVRWMTVSNEPEMVDALGVLAQDISPQRRSRTLHSLREMSEELGLLGGW